MPKTDEAHQITDEQLAALEKRITDKTEENEDEDGENRLD